MPGVTVKQFLSGVEMVFCEACGENLGQTPDRYGNEVHGHGIEQCIRYITKRLDEAADNCPGREAGDD